MSLISIGPRKRERNYQLIMESTMRCNRLENTRRIFIVDAYRCARCD